MKTKRTLIVAIMVVVLSLLSLYLVSPVVSGHGRSVWGLIYQATALDTNTGLKNSVGAKDACEVKKEYEEAKAEAAKAGASTPQPTQPTGDDGRPLNRTTIEQNLASAKNARNESETKKNSDEAALNQATEAMTRFNSDPQKGQRLAALQGEIARLESQIKMAQAANAKVPIDKRLE